MRLLGGIVVAIVAGSIARADIPPAKSPPANLNYELKRKFIAAGIAADAGDTEYALEQYFDLSQYKWAPESEFNTARAFLRAGRLSDAIFWFKSYLAHAENAGDAIPVKKLIADLEAKFNASTIGVGGGSEVDAMIFVDGEKIGKSPTEVVPDGKSHRIARVGTTTVMTRTVVFAPGSFVSASEASGKGNLLIDAPNAIAREFDIGSGQKARVNEIVAVRPGKYSSRLADDTLCVAIDFAVADKGITYVYVEGKSLRSADRTECTQVSKLRVHHVHGLIAGKAP